MEHSVTGHALQVISEVMNFDHWTLPEWLGVISGVSTIILLLRWVIRRIASMTRALLSHTGRFSQKLMLLGIISEHKMILDSLETSLVFEKHPSLSVIFVARVLIKLLLTANIAAIVFIISPQPIDSVLSSTILILMLFVIAFILKELQFLMRAEERVKIFRERFLRIVPKLKNADSRATEYLNDVAARLDEMCDVARRMDLRRWDFEFAERVQKDSDHESAAADTPK